LITNHFRVHHKNITCSGTTTSLAHHDTHAHRLYAALMAVHNTVPICLLLISGWTFAMHERMPVAEVCLNGKGPYRFIVDTGATASSVRPRLAAALGLSANYRVEIVTVAGLSYAPATAKVHIETSGAQAHDVELLWVEFRGPSHIDGVLGQSFLSHFDYLINADGLHLGQPARQRAAALQAAPISFTLREGRMLIPAYTASHQHLDLIVDSAATVPVLFRTPTQFSTSTLTAVNGAIAASAVNLPTLRVGRHWFYDVPAAVVASASSHRTEDGLLPTNLFRAIFVDNQRGQITLQP
jgi:predicted aspartyl protease